METKITVEPISVEIQEGVHYLWGKCSGFLPIIFVSIAFIISIEIVFKFIILARKKKRLAQAFEQKLEDLKKEQEKVYWEYLKRKVRE